MDAFTAGLIFEKGPAGAVPRYTLYPTTEVDALAFQDKSTVCWMAAPEPLTVCDADVELLEKKEILADAVPVVVGAKLIVKGTL
jgi:hypothetical protein